MNRPTHLFGGSSPPSSAYDPSSSDDNKASTNTAPLVSSASARHRLEDDAAMALVGLCVSSPIIARPPPTMTAPPKTEIEAEKKKTKKENTYFPVVLMSIVSDPLNSDVITWTPDGLSFVVLKPYHLADYVLPKHFNKGKVGKYCSFVRKLSRYGFKKSTASSPSSTNLGEDVFSHPLFLRDAPDLCQNIRVGGTSTSGSGPSVSRRRCSASSSSSSTSSSSSVAKKKKCNNNSSSKAQPLHTSVSSSSSSIALGSMSSSPIVNDKILERSAVQQPRAPRPLLSSLPSSLSTPSIVRDEARRAARLHFLARRQCRRRANVNEVLGRMISRRRRSELVRDYNPSGEEVRMILRRALEVVGNGPTTGGRGTL